jgi:hypothetical protein
LGGKDDGLINSITKAINIEEKQYITFAGHDI